MAFRSGYVAIVGRPNVGKSALMNSLIGQKISITSNKPQTTRNRILGIVTKDDFQIVYIDTPGLHLDAAKVMNRCMNRTADSSMHGVDLICFVVDATSWTAEDASVAERLHRQSTPVIMVVNKIDRIGNKERLLPLLQQLADKGEFAAIIPVSARTGDNIHCFEHEVVRVLPDGTAAYPEEYVTDRSERFLAAEIIREKLMRGMNKELPYATAVEIEQFKLDDELLRIVGLIWVERAGQKKIVIGKGGERLKEIGRQARGDMQKLFAAKVFLQLWVKVRGRWSNDEQMIDSFGYRDGY